MTSAAARTIDQDKAKPAKASALEIFRERCEARAILIANGYLDFQIAIDELQEAAVRQGLVATHGQDEIQRILAESFGRWNMEWV
jgi:hypothetical protein